LLLLVLLQWIPNLNKKQKQYSEIKIMSFEQNKTKRGERPDLAAVVDPNPYLGYIGNKVLPKVQVNQKTGSVYYQTLQNDSAAQTGRNAGTAPTAVNIAESATTFSTAERVKRYQVSYDESAQMGVENADIQGALASKRSVENALEEAIAAALFEGASSTAAVGTSFITAAQGALNTIKRYPGRKALVTSYSTFNKIMRTTEVVNRFGLSSAAVTGIDALAIVGRNPEALKMLLASIIGVDEVLVGDDSIWGKNSARLDRVAVVALPDPSNFSHKMGPVLGKTVIFLPDGKNEVLIQSFPEDLNLANYYDALSWFDVKVLNTGAAVILTGLSDVIADEASSSSSSSSSSD